MSLQRGAISWASRTHSATPLILLRAAKHLSSAAPCGIAAWKMLSTSCGSSAVRRPVCGLLLRLVVSGPLQHACDSSQCLWIARLQPPGAYSWAVYHLRLLTSPQRERSVSTPLSLQRCRHDPSSILARFVRSIQGALVDRGGRSRCWSRRAAPCRRRTRPAGSPRTAPPSPPGRGPCAPRHGTKNQA